jgi:hypothetical protein
MAKSRYLTNRTLFDSARAEPRHYATWTVPPALRGYNIPDLLDGQVIYEHIWEYGDRVDKLAAKYMSDDQSWWIICYVNNIAYPLGVKVGTKIRIPSDSRAIMQKLGLV